MYGFSQQGIRGGTIHFPRGAVTEISGSAGGGKTELVLRELARQGSVARMDSVRSDSGGRIAWIEDSFTAYPCAFEQAGVDLDRVLFVEAGMQTLWCAHQALRSGIFETVVVSLHVIEIGEVDLRRLQLSSEKAQAGVILLPEQPAARGAWAIALQLRVEGRRVEFLKDRRASVGRRERRESWATAKVSNG